jgi:hypothetical protein
MPAESREEMSGEWFCRIAGQEIGPLSAAQLRAMTSSGRLVPADPIRQGRDGPWMPAGMVNGLFEAPAAAQPKTPAPSAAGAAPAVSAKQKIVPAAEPDEAFWAPPDESEAATNSGEALDFLDHVAASSPPLPAAGVTLAAPSKTRQNQKLFVRLIIGLLAVLTVLVIALILVTTLRDRSSQTSLGDSARKAAKSAKTDDEIWGDPKKGSPAPVPGGLLDATKESWKVGEVSVKVASAEIGHPTLYRGSTPIGQTQEEFLVVHLELSSTNPSKKIDYPGWYDRDSRVKMTDDQGNQYRMKMFSSGIAVDGQSSGRSIYPDKTSTETLVFERPIPAARYLQLELPGSGLKVKDKGRFYLPISMLVKLPPKDPPPAEKTKTEPKTPEGKVPEGKTSEAKSSDAKTPEDEPSLDPAKVPALDLKRQEGGPGGKR